MNYDISHSTFYGCKITSLARYKPPLSKLLIQYKENYDVELKSVFLSYYKSYLKIKFSGYSIVLVPSSLKKIKMREFDHLEMIFKELGLPILKVLSKKDGKEQKKNSASERKKVYQAINIHGGEVVSNKKILLVDDVITTGSTLKACLQLLKKYKPKRIEILTIMNVAPLEQYHK
ncbi:MAG: phosphoribosyltransferase family protein [Bacilli bacterium]